MDTLEERNIVHIGLFHRKDDIRIFYKECDALSKAGYKISYITSDIYGDTESYEENGIKVCFYPYKSSYFDIGLGAKHGIVKRVYLKMKLWKKRKKDIIGCVLKLNPDVIHIHEYEVLFIVKTLLKKNKNIKLVYDIHEDNPKHLWQKYKKTGFFVAFLVKKIVEIKEKMVISKASLVFTATDYLNNLASRYNKNVLTIKNYPKADDICCNNDDIAERESNYCYSGGITEDRGITLLVKNSDAIMGKFLLAGNIKEGYEENLKKEYADQWKNNVIYKGYLSRKEVNEFYSSSVVGLCTLQYHPNYINALPIKLFEYMAAGIPVICSDFPLWKQIVEETRCGIVVDCYDESAIIRAVNKLLDDRNLAKELGDNGKKAVKIKYNWEQEKNILVEGYRSIL